MQMTCLCAIVCMVACPALCTCYCTGLLRVFHARVSAGAGIGWLYPLVDGAPAVGWEMAARYLVLPALLVDERQIAVY